MAADPSHAVLLRLSTMDATDIAAQRVFAALAVAAVDARDTDHAGEGRRFRGRTGAITIEVSRGEPGDLLHEEYPIRVFIDAGASVSTTRSELADLAAIELLNAAFGVIQMLPALTAGVARWREFVMDREGRLQSLILERVLPA
jgi:hypothetical protein